jgi:hypothetical protein
MPITVDQVESIISLELDKKDEWLDRIRVGYTNDPYYKDILHMFEKGLDQNLSKQELRRCQARAGFFTLEADGLLTHNPTGNLCILNIKDLKIENLHETHDPMFSGNFGEKCTLSAISKRFFWRRR